MRKIVVLALQLLAVVLALGLPMWLLGPEGEVALAFWGGLAKLLPVAGKIYKAADATLFGGALPGGSRRMGAGQVVARSTATAAGAALPALTRGMVPGPPQLLPAPGRQPVPGARGGIQRALPGGRSGYTYDPYDLDTPADRYGRPVAVHPAVQERIQCPSGYVAVDLDGDGQSDACVLKGVARAMGLWKGRPKPPISGYDARAIKRADRAKKRVKKLAQNVGYSCAPKGRRRGR